MQNYTLFLSKMFTPWIDQSTAKPTPITGRNAKPKSCFFYTFFATYTSSCVATLHQSLFHSSLEWSGPMMLLPCPLHQKKLKGKNKVKRKKKGKAKGRKKKKEEKALLLSQVCCLLECLLMNH